MLHTILFDSLRRATVGAKWALLLTLVNLSLSVLALLPVLLWLETVNGASLFAERLLKDTLDLEWLLVALRIGKSAFPIRLAVTSGLALLVGYLVTTFLSGGIIATFVPHEGPRAFWADCYRYVWPLLAVGLITGLLLSLAGGVLALAWGTLYGFLTENQTTPWRAEFMPWIGLGVALVVSWSIYLVMDYLKLALVVHAPQRSWTGRFQAWWRLFICYPGTTLGLYLSTSVLWLLLVGGLLWLMSQIMPITWFSSALLMLLSQVVVFARHWVRLVFIAGGCRLLATLL
ncbi:MAG: hypothetical protein ACUVR8_01370 [Acidobacteriota bacterium]